MDTRLKVNPTTSQGVASKRAGSLQRKCACGGTPGPTGECEDCKRKRLSLQTKLAINQPGDHCEREADQMADMVMSGRSVSGVSPTSSISIQRKGKDDPPSPHAKLQRKCACGRQGSFRGECEECRERRLGITAVMAKEDPKNNLPINDSPAAEAEAERIAAQIMSHPSTKSTVTGHESQTSLQRQTKQ